MALAKRQVNPSRSSIALSRMAPPSELACGWSNFAMIGLEIPWTWRALCAIQAVAIEPPRFCAMSRLVNALFAHFRDSMALFFHPSRIILARLLDRVREANGLRHGSRSTEKSYIGWIPRFILFYGKAPPGGDGRVRGRAIPQLARRRGAGGRVDPERDAE